MCIFKNQPFFRQRFRLQISIRPHNDVPKIEMGPALKGKAVERIGNL
jgi:hypothetical protein